MQDLAEDAIIETFGGQNLPGGGCMRGLKGKRVVVASGATGIGAATAERLGAEGVKLTVGDINEEGVRATVERIRRAGGTAEAVRFDLNDAASIEALMSSCVKQYGGLDGLVTVGANIQAARNEQGQDLLTMDVANWERTFAVNITGHGLTMRAAIPHMIRAGGGVIANVTSLAAIAGYPGQPAYSSSKAAENALIRHVASRWGKQNIRCNGIAPGWVLTEALKEVVDKKILEREIAAIPSTRLGTPEDMAALLAFLMSDDSAWITGQIININGGGVFRD
jgi:NAD(P)-dependent dehydrogenase (short-subunit alcohol dehydrogenase family)